jgi:seryl-tRNA synthetase
MSLQRTYELGDLDRSTIDVIRDAIRAGRRSGLSLYDGAPDEVRVEASDDAALAYVDTLVSDVRRTRGKLRQKVLDRSPASCLYAGDIDAELRASGELYELDAGLVGFRGRLLRLFQFFADEFLALARDYRAEENHYPVLLPLGIFDEVGYFGHFPQQVTFCAHWPEDLPFLDGVVQAARACGRLPDEVLRDLVPPAHALKPAVCLPCYRQRRDAVLPAEGAIAVTMQNHVFRYEGGSLRAPGRLWDFTVRDVVFFGDASSVAARRQEVMSRVMDLCRELDLDATLQLANDPFFLDQTRDMRLYQRMGEVKYELLLSLPQRREELAVSSFNLHRDFYTRVYNIRRDGGELAESGCMGFGIDRWVYAFVSQKGLDARRWPARVARRVDDIVRDDERTRSE